MNPFSIGNLNNSPLNNVNRAFVNVDGSNASSFLLSNKHVPTGPHTLPAPGNNVRKKQLKNAFKKLKNVVVQDMPEDCQDDHDILDDLNGI